jgi:hypothetical protein
VVTDVGPETNGFASGDRNAYITSSYGPRRGVHPAPRDRLYLLAERSNGLSRPVVYTENSHSGVVVMQFRKDGMRYDASRAMNWA